MQVQERRDSHRAEQAKTASDPDRQDDSQAVNPAVERVTEQADAPYAGIGPGLGVVVAQWHCKRNSYKDSDGDPHDGAGLKAAAHCPLIRLTSATLAPTAGQHAEGLTSERAYRTIGAVYDLAMRICRQVYGVRNVRIAGAHGRVKVRRAALCWRLIRQDLDTVLLAMGRIRRQGEARQGGATAYEAGPVNPPCHTPLVDAAAIQKAFDAIFDQALLFHGYTDYMRDYEVLIESVADTADGTPASFDRYLFRHCVEATVATSLAPETWRTSLDDRLLDDVASAYPDGFVWAVKWQCLYPGAELIAESERAASWSETVGVPFYEVVIETNVQKLTLVFSHLEVTSVGPGYSPFILTG